MATQNKLQRLEVNVGQGSQVVDFTEEETTSHQTFVKELQIADLVIKNEQLAKTNARAAALAKLAALGLTEEEVAAL